MKIRFMKEDALIYFKSNIFENMQYYLEEDNASLIKRYDYEPFEFFNEEVKEFELISGDDPSLTDYQNTINLHQAMKHISRTHASDERLWAGLSHDYLWKYAHQRLNLNSKTINENKILGNYFFNRTRGKKRNLILNPISKLWWVGESLYDESNSNPYYLLEYFKYSYSTKVFQLFSSNYTNNFKVLKAIIEAILELEKDGIVINRMKFLSITRYINFIGGVVLIDYLNKEELKNIVKSHIYTLLNNKEGNLEEIREETK